MLQEYFQVRCLLSVGRCLVSVVRCLLSLANDVYVIMYIASFRLS